MAEVDILLKLFDTLKDAQKEIFQICQALLSNQNSISSYMKTLPMSDLKEALKEHTKESSDNIGTCTETVETKTDTILEKVNIIDSKIGKMILVVGVAFSLLTVAYFFGRYTMDYTDKFSEWEIKMDAKNKEDHEELRNEIIKAVREELRKSVREENEEE